MRTITVGRDNSCDIVINNSRISRIHGQISLNGSSYVYRDSSSNGTRINGVILNRGGERAVAPGDSVLLSDAEALPWHKVQALLPLDASGDDNVTYKDGVALIIFGYIFALMGGLLGIIFGLILATGKQTTSKGKVNKYTPAAIANGWVIFSLALLSMAVQLIILINNS
ncbi:MAG: FHA domain-containing protein [Tannerellaceae bacterium]|jgi:pSer/pThr/pTyr-binding forkhead associated (FHA) protein|nr:FHA domain-containing protein [Tannerellaceae bacterium]